MLNTLRLEASDVKQNQVKNRITNRNLMKSPHLTVITIEFRKIKQKTFNSIIFEQTDCTSLLNKADYE